MNDEKSEILKEKVREFWNRQACGTQYSDSVKYTKEYYDEIESSRYSKEPEIFSFAQFTRYHGHKILEVGIGAGTDFLQWVRAGAIAYGVDLTPEGVEHNIRRLKVYGLQAEDIKVADTESLPYPDDSFDLVYSWGVIHHTPDTAKALSEIIRVTKPGGTCKIMIYHRHSLLALFFWIKYALFKLKPWKSLSWVLWNHMESYGTKAFTRKEAIKMLNNSAVIDIRIKTILSYWDRLERFNPLLRTFAKILSWILGKDRVGWFLTIEFNKK